MKRKHYSLEHTDFVDKKLLWCYDESRSKAVKENTAVS